jgi:chloride channel 3/4/5
MAIGACYGRAIGIMVEAFYKSNPKLWIFSDCPPEGACIAPGTYAFLGAAASLGGITKVTVTVVVVMFELTGAVDHILPTMITVISTKLVGDIFYHGGIADKAIEWKGFPFLNQHHSSLGPSPVGQMMVTDIKSIPATGWKLNELLDFLQQTDCRGFPVIKGVDNNRIEGFIEREDILRVINRATIEFSVSQSAHCFFNPHQIGAMSSSSIDFGRYVDVNPVIVHPKLPLETVESFFAKIG